MYIFLSLALDESGEIYCLSVPSVISRTHWRQGITLTYSLHCKSARQSQKTITHPSFTSNVQSTTLYAACCL